MTPRCHDPLTLECRECGATLEVRTDTEAWAAGWWVISRWPAEGQEAQCGECYAKERFYA